MSAISLKTVRVDQIEPFAEEIARTQPAEGVVPVSRSRARAWAHNPRARPDDPAMLVAFRGARCVGHLGMYPDVLLIGPRRERLFWLSAFFVHPEFRASGAGPMLLMRALALNEHLGVSNPSAEAARIYQTLRFDEPPPVRFCRLAVARLNLLGMPLRLLRRTSRTIFGHEPDLVNRAIDLTQTMTRGCLYPILGLSCRRAVARIRFERLSDIASDLMPPPSDHASAPQFDRSATFFNWMLHDPWVSTDARDLVRNNYFPDVQQRFRTEAIRLSAREDGRLVGVLVFRVVPSGAGEAIRLLDLRGIGPDGTLPATAALVSLACRHRPDIIEMPGELRGDLSGIPGVGALIEQPEHRYFFHARRGDRETADALRRVHLRYLDGDVAFT